MRSAVVVACAGFIVSALGPPAWAHHGKDFLIVETVDLPERGRFYFFSGQDFIRHEGATGIEVSPGLLLGLGRSVAFEVHGHLAREEGRWTYESTAPALRVRLPLEGRVQVGLSGEYELAHEDGVPDRLEGRLIVAYRGGSTVLTGNLVVEWARGEGEPTEVGYAVGFRPNLGRRLGWGFEAQGGLENSEGNEVLLALYAEPSDRVTLKVGVGRGFDGGPDWTVRTGIVARF